VMQHVSSDDVKNAEASEDSDCPRLERWRWSPGVGAIGNYHIQITSCTRSKIQRSAVLRNQMPVLADYVLRPKAPCFVKGGEEIFKDALHLAPGN